MCVGPAMVRWWDNCIIDLLIACGQQSKHNDFPVQKAVIETEVVRRGGFLTYVLALR